MIDQAGRKNVTKHALVTPIALSITIDYHNWVRDMDMYVEFILSIGTLQ